jgi:hypothetical protein
MKEALLQYAWQYRLFNINNLKTTKGENVDIIDIGKPNTDAGPDFFNAKIKIDNTLWAGNVEVHLRSSDWQRHKHEQNKNYNSIILHIVGQFDQPIFRSNGEEIPQIELPYFPDLEKRYEALLAARTFVPCANKICDVPAIVLRSWQNTLLSERLEQKVNTIQSLLKDNHNDWEETFYITLAHNFGTGINGYPFELLAKSLPQRYLSKHKDNLFQLEALFFGQSGLLDIEPDHHDEYANALRKEYAFLQAKYTLSPIDGHLWKLLRLRPVNFPHVRLAQLAALTHQSTKLFSKIIDNPTLEHLSTLFQCQPSEYWTTHYSFQTTSASKNKPLGKSTLTILLINTVVPFLFAYGKYRDNEVLQDRAISLLEDLPAEKNSIIEGWKELNIQTQSAFDTQALLQLKRAYCDDKKCLRCRIGHTVLTQIVQM